jgi:putative DNA primase/helicase
VVAAVEIHPDEHPKLVTLNPDGIPLELRERPQWVVSRVVRRPDGGLDKPPLQIDGRDAKTNDPSTWTTFGRAHAAVRSGKFDVLGYVFSADDLYTGIDLDGALDPTGCIDKRGESLVGALSSWT